MILTGRSVVTSPVRVVLRDSRCSGYSPGLAGDERLVLVDQVQLLGLPDEPGAEPRVGDGDQRHGPLADVLPVEVGDAELGDDVVDVAAVQGHPGPLLDERHDARDLALLGGRLQREDGGAALGEDGAAHEVGLPADPAVEGRPDRFRRGLSGEVDLHGGVDGHHLLVGRDDQRVVGVVDAAELDGRVVVDEVVGRLVSHAERRDRLAAVDGLPGVVDHPAPHEVGDPVGEQLGVHAEVLLAREGGEDGVGDAAVAGLDGVAVLDDAGDIAADAAGDLVRNGGLELQQRLLVDHREVDLVEVEEPLAVHARHPGVDLGHHHDGALHRRLHDVDAQAQAEVAVLVGERDLDQRHVDRDETPAQQRRHLREEDRRVVGEAAVDQGAGVVADEEGVVPHVRAQPVVVVGRHAERPDLQDLGVEDRLRVVGGRTR